MVLQCPGVALEVFRVLHRLHLSLDLHVATVVDFVAVKPDGRRSSFQDEYGMRVRIDPRHVSELRVPDDAVSRIRILKGVGSSWWWRYVQLAAGQRSYRAFIVVVA